MTDFPAGIVSGDLSLGDILAVVVGSVALLVTALLSLVGFRIAADAGDTKKKLDDLASAIGLEREHLFGLRATARTLGQFVSDAKTAIDIQRRATENIIRSLGGEDSDQLPAFRESILVPLVHLERLQKYLEIISPHEGPTFSEDVNTLCQRFPDAETVNTLEDLVPILPKEEKKIVLAAAFRLKQQIGRAALDRRQFNA